MGGMTIGLVIAVIVVIVVALIAMRWRSASGEQQALRHYQHALDTLRTVSDRMESSRPVVEPKSQAGSGDHDTVSDRPVPDRSVPDRSGTLDRTGASRRQAPQQRQGESDRQVVSNRQGTTARSPSGTVAWSTASETDQVTSTKSVRQGQREQSGTPGPATRQGSLARQITEARQTQAARRAQAPAGDEPTAGPSDQEQPQKSGGGTNGHTSHGVLVFEEDTLGLEPSQAHASGSFAGPVVTRAGRRALQRSSRPQSRMPVVLGSLVILVVIAVVVALALGVGKHPTTSPPTTAHHSTNPGHHNSDTTSTSSSTTTSSTAPPSVVPEASTATDAAATYTAPAGNYTVTLTSSGACWVYAKSAATGDVLWTGTLNQGQAQQLTGTGEIVVQMGHANTMSVTLNGVPVQYPPQYQAVFTMTFAPPT
jgi:hypothetical protein